MTFEDTSIKERRKQHTRNTNRENKWKNGKPWLNKEQRIIMNYPEIARLLFRKCKYSKSFGFSRTTTNFKFSARNCMCTCARKYRIHPKLNKLYWNLFGKMFIIFLHFWLGIWSIWTIGARAIERPNERTGERAGVFFVPFSIAQTITVQRYTDAKKSLNR